MENYFWEVVPVKSGLLNVIFPHFLHTRAFTTIPLVELLIFPLDYFEISTNSVPSSVLIGFIELRDPQ